MTRQSSIVQKNTPCETTHRAFYRAVSTQRWYEHQKRGLKVWEHEKTLKSRQVYTRRYYLPLLKPWLEHLPEDLSILEVGSGPVCAAQYLKKCKMTYIDPMLDVYRRMFPGVMPEKATYIAEMVEKYKFTEKGNEKFDLVLCLDTLSETNNPELVLNRLQCLLKENGYIVISMNLWPTWFARAHYMLARYFPLSWGSFCLYSYTKRGFCHTLQRHFSIESEHVIKPSFYWATIKQEMLFVCKKKGT